MGNSLAVQWLGVCASLLRTWVQSLVDSTSCVTENLKKNLLFNLEFSGIQGSLKPENAEVTREKKKKKDPKYYDQRDALQEKTRCVV